MCFPRIVFALCGASLALAPTLIFLFFYERATSFLPGMGAHLSHINIMACIWGGGIALWIIFRRFFSSRMSAILAACVCSIISFSSVIYYLIVAAGLHGFGKVITWPILRPYVINVRSTFEYAGVSMTLCMAACVLFLSLLLYLWKSIFLANDWMFPFIERGVIWGVILTGLTFVIAVRVFEFFDNPPTYLNEPVSMTFFPKSFDEGFAKAYRYDKTMEEAENRAREILRADITGPGRNIILIISDALRADHMTPFDYERNTTPLLMERIGKAAAGRPMRAVSVCAETICGMPGLLYSKQPENMHANAIGMAEALKIRGYENYILLTGDHTNYFGLSKIYRPADLYFDASTQSKRFVNDDKMLFDAAMQLPDFSGHPAFIQVMLLSNHPLGVRWPGSKWYEPVESYAPWLAKGGELDLSERQIELAKNYYDNGVRQADEVIDELLDILENKGYLANAIVLITADHGEMLGEHGILSHAAGVFQPVLDIPAIFLRYGYTGGQLPYKKWISQVDLAPTLFIEAGIKPVPTWKGIALQSNDDRSYFSFQQKGESGLLSLEDGFVGYKYWVNADDGREYVFNLGSDWGEKINLIDRLPSHYVDRWRNIVLGNIIKMSDK